MILTNGGRRIATAMGAMLADPDSLGNLAEDAQETLFDPEYWRARGELVTVTGGRGSAWFIASGARVRRVAPARTPGTARPARAAARRRALPAHGLALPLRSDHATHRGCRALERGARAACAARAGVARRRRNRRAAAWRRRRSRGSQRAQYFARREREGRR